MGERIIINAETMSLKQSVNELELDGLFKHYDEVVEGLLCKYGPEGAYEISKKLIKAADEDMVNGMAQIQAYENPYDNIKAYIKKCQLTWTVEGIFEEYKKHKKGFYISHTAKEIVDKFRPELEKLF